MAFDFPSSPTVGQVYTSGGTSYVWSGTGWMASQPFNSADYVKKAGDTMLGDLLLSGNTSAALGATTKQYVDSIGSTLDSAKVAKAGDTMSGALTVNANFTANITSSEGFLAASNLNGWTGKIRNSNAGASAGGLFTHVGNDAAMSLAVINAAGTQWAHAFYGNGTVTHTGALTANSVTTDYVSLGSAAVASATDLTRHISLYGNSYGFSVTSGTLNLVAGGGVHAFTSNSATIAGTVVSPTVRASYQLISYGWAGDNNNGIIWFDPGQTRYINVTPGVMHFQGGQINSSTQGRLWGANDFSAPLPLAGGTMTGQITTAGSGVGVAYGAGTGIFEVRGNGSGGAVFSLHRPGAYAINFGLDTDNILRVGGWSMGGVAYAVHHDGNVPNNASYLKFPSSLMFTWCVAPGGGGAQGYWVYFPVAFPNVCMGVVCTAIAAVGYEMQSHHVQQVQTNAVYIQPRYSPGGTVGYASQQSYIFAWGY